MSVLGDLKMYGRFAWGLRGFLGHRITLEEARATVGRRMAEREANFLRLLEKGILGYARSPYVPLLKLAQVELGDIQRMVGDRGLEGTLLALREAGVYVSFEEFKGRQPIVRDGRVIPVKASDFDNPYLKHYYYGQSGGTTGAGTRVPTDLDYLAARSPYWMLAYEAHDIMDVPAAIWFGVLPDSTGLVNVLYNARFGHIPQKWFSSTTMRDFRPSLKDRLATRFVIVMGRLFGAPIPWPEPLSLDEADVVAHWAARALEVHGACLITTQVSRALRVCLAALEEGLDLAGATFMVGGEPPTPAKVRVIGDTGARWLPFYPITEVGLVGLGCACPADGSDLHFVKDALALIQYPRRVPGSEITVDAFHFTALLPSTGKLMLNVESDDYGLIETRSCGCALEGYGYTEHLHGVRSFRKLTGEGVTLVGSEMVHILEEVLPACFGGSPLDYQLLEEEDQQGLTRLSLLVSPRLEIANEGAVVETVLEALRRSSVSADLARAVWSEAGTLRVKRMEPVWTARGKLMPLHLERRSQ